MTNPSPKHKNEHLAAAQQAGGLLTPQTRVVDFSHTGTTLEGWKQELRTPPDRVVSYDSSSLLPCIGLFGTAATSTWRSRVQTVLGMLCEKNGINPEAWKDSVYNPQMPAGMRASVDAATEADHLATDSVVLFQLEKGYASVGSCLELGIIALRSFLVGRKTVAFIEVPGANLRDSEQRARSMVLADAHYLQQQTPGTFHLVNNSLDAVTQAFAYQLDFMDFLMSGNYTSNVRTFANQKNLKQQACISGTSHKPDSTERTDLFGMLQAGGISFKDTVRPNWRDTYETEEIPLKDESLVNCLLVTDPASKGALKDVGLAIFRAAIRGSYALIYLPEMSPDSPDSKDYNRARNLAHAHMVKLVQDFPWVEHYVKFVDNIETMAECCRAIISTSDSAVTRADISP
jgi:hypothetical protein